MEQTLLIIKPDATKRNLIGHIIGRLERAGFEIAQMRLERLTPEKARRFYAVHEGKTFLDSLVEFMSSGPVVPILLRKQNAVADLRLLIGATDPAKAACGTLRQEIALNIQENSVHASDSPENAVKEIAFFFE
ncbi:multifunctional nucleoside diphosphate kinase and apyrimidinic endonuclease and 3'-phosphodiesterase [Candidatus Zixiibacteriota bacterium]|nr:multifunctional nucleoside diphosphate kinase and apyrimidinic endonuclease and 3'-phosphodiesterase [candidate division Zixibacteria bacterium]